MLRNKIQCSSSFRPGGLRGRCLGPNSRWVRTRATPAAHRRRVPPARWPKLSSLIPTLERRWPLNVTIARSSAGRFVVCCSQTIFS